MCYATCIRSKSNLSPDKVSCLLWKSSRAKRCVVFKRTPQCVPCTKTKRQYWFQVTRGVYSATAADAESEVQSSGANSQISEAVENETTNAGDSDGIQPAGAANEEVLARAGTMHDTCWWMLDDAFSGFVDDENADTAGGIGLLEEITHHPPLETRLTLLYPTTIATVVPALPNSLNDAYDAVLDIRDRIGMAFSELASDIADLFRFVVL